MVKVLLDDVTLRTLGSGAVSAEKSLMLARAFIEQEAPGASEENIAATFAALDAVRSRWAEMDLLELQRSAGMLTEWRNTAGTLLLDIPEPYVRGIAVAGICGRSAVNLAGVISNQLDVLDPAAIRKELARQMPELTAEQLGDDAENRARLVWHACVCLWAAELERAAEEC